MYIDDPPLEAQYHEETYLAMLRAALRRRGDKARFARDTAVVSQTFLSYVTSEKEAGGQRHLSPDKAAQIADQLPWPAEVRESFVNHVTLHREARARQLAAIEQVARDGVPAELLGRVRSDYAAITPHMSASEARLRYRAVRDECREALRWLRPQHSVLDFAEVCLILCAVQGVLDRPDETLFYSKLAAGALLTRDADDFQMGRTRYDELLVQAWRQQASAYHIMGLPRSSLDACGEGLKVLASAKVRSAYSEARVRAIQIRAWSGVPRFSIGTVRELADEAYRASERMESEQEYRSELLNIQRALGHAETQHGNVKRADGTLRPLLERAAVQTEVNLVLRTGLLKSYAQLQFKTGDVRGGTTTLKTALELAMEAGLAHQIRQGREQFGPVADALLREVAGERDI